MRGVLFDRLDTQVSADFSSEYVSESPSVYSGPGCATRNACRLLSEDRTPGCADASAIRFSSYRDGFLVKIAAGSGNRILAIEFERFFQSDLQAFL